MVELGHLLSTHLMLAEKQRFYCIILPNWIDKTYQRLGVLGISSYDINNREIYRIYKYYENIFTSIFDR